MKNEKELLLEMLEDMRKAPEVYRPSRYWKGYVARNTAWLLRHDINNFRNYDAPFRSFGGGAERLSDEDYQRIKATYRKSRILKGITACLLKLRDRFPELRTHVNLLLPTFHMTNMEYRSHYQKELFLQQLESSVSESPELLKFSDQCFGQPSDVVEFKGSHYTSNFYLKVKEYFFVKRYIDFAQVESVLEIGPGYGAQMDVILQDNEQIRGCLVEIPPQLYLAQQYLEACFPGEVCKYHEVKKMGVANALRDFRVICLAPWQIKELPENAFDFFWNMASFQEMSPDVVKNYASYVQRATKKFLYIANSIRARDESAPQRVRTHTSYDEYISFFDEFEPKWVEDRQGLRRGIFVKR